MSIGSSGRIVIEIEPEMKREIYALLKEKGLTLKEWFLLQSKLLIEENKNNET